MGPRMSVRCDVNSADALTKHQPQDVLENYVVVFSMRRQVGRAVTGANENVAERMFV